MSLEEKQEMNAKMLARREQEAKEAEENKGKEDEDRPSAAYSNHYEIE